MDGFDIVMVITIILFARLGIRLLVKYNSGNKSKNNHSKKE